MHAIGNLASDSVDPEAAQTRELIKEGGGYHTVLNLIWETEDERTRVYALGALRNLTARVHIRVDAAEKMRTSSKYNAAKGGGAGPDIGG